MLWGMSGPSYYHTTNTPWWDFLLLDDPITGETVNLTYRLKTNWINNNFATESPCQLTENTPITDNDICQYIMV